jgi:hypothetical protein
MTEKQAKALLTRAKARVVWGDFPEDVVEMLAAAGVDQGEAERFVGRLVRKRNKQVRWRGWLKIGTGVGMMVGSAVFFRALPWAEWVAYANELTYGWTEQYGEVLPYFMIAVGLVGIWWTFRGICAVVVPQAEELSDVE